MRIAGRPGMGAVGWVVLALCAAAFARPSVARAQTQGSVTLAAGFTPDPQRLAGTAGGPVSAQAFDPDCRGYIAQQANHAINVTGGGLEFLRVFVEASSDTTLVIRAPNGRFYCNDDRYQYNPGLDAAMGAGLYLVWVGTYAPNTTSPYTISFSQLRSTVPASALPATPTPTTGPSSVAPGTTVTANSGPGGRIYDNHTTSATVTIAQSCVTNGLQVRVRGNHTYYSDMIVRLRSPTGLSETLQSHEMRSPFRTYTSRHFKNSQAAGVWTLGITDDVAADGGSLDGFTLSITCQ